MPEMQPLKEQDKLTWDQVYQCDFLRIPGLTAVTRARGRGMGTFWAAQGNGCVLEVIVCMSCFVLS